LAGGAAAESSYIDIVSAIAAQSLLMRGFTTVRDTGGPVFGLKRAIDEGLVAGPRIFPSGAFISQTSGHGVVEEGALADLLLVDGNPL
jgi:imidazolonepropionase-like amidohydrolase